MLLSPRGQGKPRRIWQESVGGMRQDFDSITSTSSNHCRCFRLLRPAQVGPGNLIWGALGMTDTEVMTDTLTEELEFGGGLYSV